MQTGLIIVHHLCIPLAHGRALAIVIVGTDSPQPLPNSVWLKSASWDARVSVVLATMGLKLPSLRLTGVIETMYTRASKPTATSMAAGLSDEGRQAIRIGLRLAGGECS